MPFTSDQLLNAKSRKDLIQIAEENNFSLDNALKKLKYETELQKLQSELVNLQQWIRQKKLRVAVLFEGRDASGKGGSIKRFKEHLNPRNSRVVALTKPTSVEKEQWYLDASFKAFPN